MVGPRIFLRTSQTGLTSGWASSYFEARRTGARLGVIVVGLGQGGTLVGEQLGDQIDVFQWPSRASTARASCSPQRSARSAATSWRALRAASQRLGRFIARRPTTPAHRPATPAIFGVGRVRAEHLAADRQGRAMIGDRFFVVFAIRRIVGQVVVGAGRVGVLGAQQLEADFQHVLIMRLGLVVFRLRIEAIGQQVLAGDRLAVIGPQQLLANFPGRLAPWPTASSYVRRVVIDLCRFVVGRVGLGQFGPLVGGELGQSLDVGQGQPAIGHPAVLLAIALDVEIDRGLPGLFGFVPAAGLFVLGGQRSRGVGQGGQRGPGVGGLIAQSFAPAGQGRLDMLTAAEYCVLRLEILGQIVLGGGGVGMLVRPAVPGEFSARAQTAAGPRHIFRPGQAVGQQHFAGQGAAIVGRPESSCAIARRPWRRWPLASNLRVATASARPPVRPRRSWPARRACAVVSFSNTSTSASGQPGVGHSPGGRAGQGRPDLQAPLARLAGGGKISLGQIQPGDVIERNGHPLIARPVLGPIERENLVGGGQALRQSCLAIPTAGRRSTTDCARSDPSARREPPADRRPDSGPARRAANTISQATPRRRSLVAFARLRSRLLTIGL